MVNKWQPPDIYVASARQLSCGCQKNIYSPWHQRASINTTPSGKLTIIGVSVLLMCRRSSRKLLASET